MSGGRSAGNCKKMGIVSRAAVYSALAVLSLAMLFPVVCMFTNSFLDKKEALQTFQISVPSSDEEAPRQTSYRVKLKLIPEKVSLMQYYSILLKEPRFLYMFWNSIILTVPIIFGQLFVSTLAAYAFGKLRFPFRDRIFFIYIIVMLMPFQVTLVPNYIILKSMNMLNSYLSVILPGIFTTFGVFLLRQFMTGIPVEYCEAGKIDGAGYFKVFSGIVMPQCKGPVASLCILVFIDNWSMVEQPLIFLEDSSMHPLSVFLSMINRDDMGIAFACGFLYMIPALLVFLYGENYFIEGIQLSGIK